MYFCAQIIGKYIKYLAAHKNIALKVTNTVDNRLI